MSPATRMSSHKVYGFPRVSGDEPPPLDSANPHFRFSPRERG